jgi:hypothetical protein
VLSVDTLRSQQILCCPVSAVSNDIQIVQNTVNSISLESGSYGPNIVIKENGIESGIESIVRRST